MMRALSLPLLAVAWCAAAPLTWERLLESTAQEPAMQAANKKVALLRNGPATQYWDDLEFRYQADGLGMLEHDFEVRLKPLPMGESKAAKNYWNSQAEYQAAKRATELSELNYVRYFTAVRYLAIEARLKIRQQIAAVNQDRIQVLLAMSGSETFSPYDLIDAQSFEADLQAEILEDIDLLHDLATEMKSWVPGCDSVVLDPSWLPSVEEIRASLAAEPLEVDSAYPELNQAARRLATTQARLELERVGDRSLIKSIGLGYTWTIAKKEYTYTGLDNNILTDNLRRREDNSRAIDRWSLNLNLRIPFFDGKDDQLSRQVDLLDREGDYLAEKRSLEQKVSRIHEEISALLKQREVQQKFVRQVDAGSLFQDFAERAGSNPLLLLKARESGLQSSLRSVRLEYEIYYRYLALLQYSGALAREGVGNHLKAGIQP